MGESELVKRHRTVTSMALLLASTLGPILMGASGSRPVHASPAQFTSLDRGWQRILLPDTPDGMQATVDKLAHGGPGLVALGSEVRPGSSNASPVAWTSTDGHTWQRSVLGGTAAGAIPWDVAAGPSGIAVVGFEPLNAPDDTPHAVFWNSRDGQRWQQSVESSPVDGATPQSVGAWGAGFVAVGTAYSTSTDGQQLGRVVVWTSSDGMHWWRNADDPALANAGASEVVAGSAGLLLVGESVADSPEAAHVLLWTSADGATWHPVPRDPSVFSDGQAISQVTTTPAGFVAFGWDTRNVGNSLVWSSSDGLTWRRLPDAAFVPIVQGNGVGSGVAAIPGLMLAVDAPHDVAPQEAPSIWASPDGADWTRAADDRIWSSGLFGVSTLVSFGDGVVAGGASAPPPPSCTPDSTPQGLYLGALPTSATIWIWTPDSAAAGPPRPDPADPRTFKLRQTDLPSGYNAGAGSYTDACTHIYDAGRVSAGLGPLTAYNVEDSGSDPQGGYTRLLLSMTAVAGDASIARQLLNDAKKLFAVDGNPADAHPPLRQRISLKIGDQTKAFLGQIGDDDIGYPVAYAVVWRFRKYVGMVAVWPRDRALAARLARAELAHLKDALK
jgi:hypothetical protein